MTKSIRSLLAVAALALAAGCATSPSNLTQIDIGVTAVAATRTTAATLVTTGKLSAAEAQAVQDRCAAITETLAALRTQPASDATAAALATTLLALNALQSYLATKGSP